MEMEMDLEEARRAVYTRVQCLDSANVLKIMGYLLLHDIGEKEMLQLALSSDSVVQAFVAKAKQELGLISISRGAQQDQGGGANAGSDDPQGGAPADPIENFPGEDPKPAHHLPGFYNPPAAMSAAAPASLSEIWERSIYFDRLTRVDAVSAATSPSSSSSAAAASTAWKPCLYFARGYCKHGSACRFLHASCGAAAVIDESQEQNSSGGGGSSGSSSGNDQGGGPLSDSLAGLEAELRELLSGRKTPVSIASLPQLYYEKFGRALQADGYLTESQRHGKAGHSLTKLLVKLKSTVTLIDRPHGQHAVVLAEEAHKFMAYKADGDDATSVNPSSRQIYLTFPAESSFTEEDVTTHFSSYGPVQDVRIPYQQKRMFGFVTFTYSETVRTILAEGNPHYIGGARVLVKPYKEKGKHGTTEKRSETLPTRSFDRNRHQQSTALKYHSQDPARYFTEKDLAAALQQKLAQLHLADIQKQMDRLAPGSSASGLLFPWFLDYNQQDDQEHSQDEANAYNGLDGLDPVDPDTASKEQALKCNLQSDQQFTTTTADSPTFFAHDIF